MINYYNIIVCDVELYNYAEFFWNIYYTAIVP